MRRRLDEVARRVWSDRRGVAAFVRAVLVPAGVAYGAAGVLRNRLYDRGWLTGARVPATVVSVGNLSVGGTGKTPTTLWLADRLAARGRRVGIVARGYRKHRRGVVVVSEGRGPLVGAAEGGDEAVMLARRFAGPVVTGERRAAAAGRACTRFGLDTIVLDDAFQHRALVRDADLVLIGGDEARQWPLPAGPLRESIRALTRARAVLAVAGAPRPACACPVFRGRLRPTALVRVEAGRWIEEPLATLEGRAVVSVAGIARPERLATTLASAGARVVGTLAFPDHHQYGPDDTERVVAAAERGLLVTTEKDLVKLGGRPGLAGLRALRVTLEVDDGETLVDTLLGSAARLDLRPN